MNPKAYGGCTCACHRWPQIKHVVACCYPTTKEDFPDWPFPKNPIEEVPVKKPKKKKK